MLNIIGGKSPRTPWQGAIHTFLKTKIDVILNSLINSLQSSNTQIFAWKTTKEALKNILDSHSQPSEWTIIFEYELPREGGRRPDIVLLNADSAIIIEVKDKSTFTAADIDQTRAYVRDIKEYHLESRDLKVIGILFLLKSEQVSLTKSGIKIVGPKSLSELIRSLNMEGMSEGKVGKWINSLYEPLPSLIDAAKNDLYK